MTEYVEVDKPSFRVLKEIMGKEIGDTCDYCKVKVTEYNYGLLAKGITSCSNPICLIQAVEDFEIK